MKKYPKEFKDYMKRAKMDSSTSFEHKLYLAWANGRKVKEVELDQARSNGAFKYLLNEDFQHKIDCAMQEVRRAFMDAYYDRWVEIFDKAWRDGTTVTYSE